MADFEELKLTVNLVDNASAGLTNIRTQLTQLTQTAGQVSTSLTSVATSTQQIGKAAGEAAPKVSSQEKALKELSRSAEETTRGMLQMALAARRGTEAFPELALAFRETTQGLKGVNVGMAELGAASRLMVVGLGGVAVGVATVAAAVVAYGVSVFKFSREMYTMSQTARSLGITFGTMKAITEQNERFGVSVDTTISGLARMQATLADLSVGGSQLRQQMMSMGVPAQRIDEITGETDAIKRRNMVITDQIKIEADLQKRGMGKEAAAEWTNRYGAWFGVDPGARSRPMQTPLTAEEKQRAKEIEDTSRAIAVQWADILKKISDIKEEFLAWGLPWVLSMVTQINEGFGGILSTIKTIALLGLKQIPILGQLIQIKELYDSLRGHGGGSAPSGGTPAPESDIGPHPATPPPAAAPAGEGPDWRERNLPWLYGKKQRTSFNTGANDNNSLLHRASFSDGFGGSGGNESRAQAIIKGGVYDALVEFYGFLQGGAKGGGVQAASFGGSAGAASARAGGGASSFGSSAFPNLDTGANAAGSAGLPGRRPNGSRVGPGAGDGAGDTPAGAPGGDGGAAPSGSLAQQRAGFQKELDNDPALKRYAIDAMQHEGGIQSNMEQLFNMAAMRHQTIRQALHSGQYGPVNRGLISGNISGKTAAAGEAALKKVYGGSNITDYATDQGMAGDPNFAKYMANREHYGMHKVEGAWFSAHGEPGVKWAQRQRAADAKAALEAKNSTASQDVNASAAVPGASGSTFDERFRGEGGDSLNGQKRLYVSPDRGALNAPLDRSSLNDNNKITSTGKLDVNVSAPAGTKVAYSGDNLLKNTSMQRQTQMMPTQGGPSVSDTASSYMRGGT